MSAPRWRGDPDDLDPVRQTLREWLPPGDFGAVVEDVDVTVIRTYGPSFELDPVGAFAFFEVKSHRANLNTALGEAQQRTFGLIHDLCKSASVVSSFPERYRGSFVVAYDAEDFRSGQCAVRAIDAPVSSAVVLTPERFVRAVNKKLGGPGRLWNATTKAYDTTPAVSIAPAPALKPCASGPSCSRPASRPNGYCDDCLSPEEF